MPPGRRPGQGFGCQDSARLRQWGREGGRQTWESYPKPATYMAALGKRGKAKQMEGRRDERSE